MPTMTERHAARLRWCLTIGEVLKMLEALGCPEATTIGAAHAWWLSPSGARWATIDLGPPEAEGPVVNFWAQSRGIQRTANIATWTVIRESAVWFTDLIQQGP